MSAKVERLVNLTVALLDARRPLTLAQIRDRLHGYGHDDPESARRMFERDKDDLRRLGVPVETVPLDAFEAEWGYTIDPDAYAMPAVDLDAEQIAALALALQVAGDEDARVGFAKVAAGAPDPRVREVATERPAPARVDLRAEALDGIADALVDRRALRFPYRTASGEQAVRTIDPYGAVQRRGAWYLVGRDHDRDALRVFRLDRLAGPVEAWGPPGAFEVPADLDLMAATEGPESETFDARVALAPKAAWQVARRGGATTEEREDGWVVAEFPDVDGERFLPWVLRVGAQAEVLAPPGLRAEAARRLRAVAAGCA